ncbi:SDR family oxidoreductase [Natronoflexus pectinivorans]|uniref:Nucleoside-diphosphate-sugar epimerase n=1 Tax=Natronoflexus pectinivorans TaxID=682526 RepID=A0A4R2GGK5_9BACT|nr:SDR family oxidoreductase [Natronoflexus pectinivorans]TCO07446.1 nucleoside-diphosphate-sugar epimerase [Natronoflexus pectinivorans]
MKKIVVNGANGYVASNFIKSLVDKDYHVMALVRSGKNETAGKKMLNALARLTDNQSAKYENLEVFDYSLFDNDFALTPVELNKIFGGNVDYFHFAASLKYDEKSKKEIFTTNIDGVKNSLDIFKRYSDKSSRFFFISTAYSCGKTSTVFKEQFYENQDISAFRNYYEQSKRYAENIVREQIEETGLNAHILRLSQVVGEHKTGIVKTDYGIFDFAKRIYGLAKRYPDATIRVDVDPKSSQNLIPIDTVVNFLMRTVDLDNLPVIVNLVAKTSTSNHLIINSLNQLLPVNLKPVRHLSREDMSAVERVISAGMSFTGAYIDTNLAFDTTYKDQVMAPNGHEINEQSVYNMLEYFINDISRPKKKRIKAEA